MSNIWFNALVRSYRFEYKGLINTEDLFDLEMRELDIIYQDLVSEKNDLTAKSLLDTNNEEIDWIQGKIDVVKGVFDYKKAQSDAQSKAAKAKAMKDELNEVIAQKQKDQLADMSIDQLKEIRDSL